jgi:hypothetical protein
MTKASVLRLLRVLIGGKFLRRGYELRERTSRWIWALLARLPDAGDLTGDEIVWIRDLGKRAVLLTRSLAEMAALRESLVDEGWDLGVNEGVDDSSDDEEVMNDVGVQAKEENGDDSPHGEVPPLGSSVPPPEKKVKVESDQVADLAPRIAEDMASYGDPATKAGEAAAQPQLDTDSASEAMDIEMEDGEIDEDEDDTKDAATSTLEEVRARVLAQLDEEPSLNEHSPRDPFDDDDEDGDSVERERARLNMRATLNMILTVAGEFYGQRDLLEFRDPFTGM